MRKLVINVEDHIHNADGTIYDLHNNKKKPIFRSFLTRDNSSMRRPLSPF